MPCMPKYLLQLFLDNCMALIVRYFMSSVRTERPCYRTVINGHRKQIDML